VVLGLVPTKAAEVERADVPVERIELAASVFPLKNRAAASELLRGWNQSQRVPPERYFGLRECLSQ
jgi:hypothetical protein